ncbi:hypothetical protein BDY17DRAFT_293383 [Neohortaea acidophila]|uniref:rRNA methyltransferase 1, mitochondrial n=1 Tax=Neohortaea acidophila TaxID=245834 RepID=A0A6A6PZY0_9PEZI|nr:uncharacterized protein BDY17DRAFT_293383 [Neohortaea acidophila]KAF2485331.1 hypothetical protein BDY17DRAFT_293383 [Neohortaea acidophila]
MSTGCPTSRVWIQRTVRAWVRTSCRSVSTTSAINRGLRATKSAERGRRDVGERFSRIQRSDHARPTQQRSSLTREPPRWQQRDRINPGYRQLASKEADRANASSPRQRFVEGQQRSKTASPAQQRSPFNLSRWHQAGRENARKFEAADAEPDRSEASSPRQRFTIRRDHQPGKDSATDGSKETSPKPRFNEVNEQDSINAIFAQLKQPLTTLRSGNSNERSLSEVRRLLRTVNQKFKAGSWLSKPIHRALTAEFPSELWGWRKEAGTIPRLWFNRPERSVQLIFEDGSSDEKVLVDIMDAEERSKLVPAAGASVKKEPASEHAAASASARQSLSITRTPRGDRISIARSENEEVDDDNPISVPYSNAASTFLYGFNVIFAALQGRRRKLYKLYLQPRVTTREAQGRSIERLARETGISIDKNVNPRLLDRMSEERAHNGVVLEASIPPAPPVLALGTPNRRSGDVPLVLNWQSAEDAAVNGAPQSLPTKADSWRHPFIVMLDGITDPGNVGSILRTCYFYGVDAVAFATNTCAKISSPALAKAASGACDAAQLLALPKPSGFVYESAKAGWKVYAAVAPASSSTSEDGDHPQHSRTPHMSTSLLASSSPLLHHPCILILGAEGEGLRENLKRRADAFVSIEGGLSAGDGLDVGIDSLNVSAAASVLLESFLRKPKGAPPKQDTTGELGF